MPSSDDVTAIRTARDNAVTYSRYRETGSLTDAKSFITAVNQLLLLLPAQAERSGAESVRFELQRYEKLREDAQKFVSQKRSSTSGITYFSTGCRE